MQAALKLLHKPNPRRRRFTAIPFRTVTQDNYKKYLK